MMRAVMHCRPPIPDIPIELAPEEGIKAAEYMSQTAIKMNRYRERRGLRRWDEEALLKVYNWAGHVARMQKYNPNRLAYKVLAFRDVRYLSTLESLYGQQCHGKRFHVWRWEQQISQIHGKEWQQIALSGEKWEDLREHWLTKRKKRLKQVDNSYYYDD